MLMHSSSLGSAKCRLYNIKSIYNKSLDVMHFKESKQYFHAALERGEYKANDRK
jgi:hypothetical protein